MCTASVLSASWIRIDEYSHRSSLNIKKMRVQTHWTNHIWSWCIEIAHTVSDAQILFSSRHFSGSLSGSLSSSCSLPFASLSLPVTSAVEHREQPGNPGCPVFAELPITIIIIIMIKTSFLPAKLSGYSKWWEVKIMVCHRACVRDSCAFRGCLLYSVDFTVRCGA